jgi:hypothetical protein
LSGMRREPQVAKQPRRQRPREEQREFSPGRIGRLAIRNQRVPFASSPGRPLPRNGAPFGPGADVNRERLATAARPTPPALLAQPRVALRSWAAGSGAVRLR